MKKLRIHNVEETSVSLDKNKVEVWECMLIKWISQKFLHPKNITQTLLPSHDILLQGFMQSPGSRLHMLPKGPNDHSDCSALPTGLSVVPFFLAGIQGNLDKQ